jgi:hypothetical protein
LKDFVEGQSPKVDPTRKPEHANSTHILPVAPIQKFNIRFEDSAYEDTMPETYLATSEFTQALRDFYEGNDDIIVVDTTDEFTEEVEESYKAQTE